MASILGIDLGTQSVKSMLLDEARGVVGVANEPYAVDIPRLNWAEQSPEIWWQATVKTIRRLRADHPEAFGAIRSVGFSGQMHALVLMEKGRAVRPAIIWMDQRSEAFAREAMRRIGFEKIGSVLHNRVFPGFAFASLLWVQAHEPDIFRRADALLMPKDYIRYRMTGEYGTDASDASATCMADVNARQWAWPLLAQFQLPEALFPPIHEAVEIAGEITRSCAEETGLQAGTPVVYGCGDQPAQSIGNGAVMEGLTICNIGTGGQISTFSRHDRYDPQLRLNAFCHAIDRAYTIFGATLCAGMSLSWLNDKVLGNPGFTALSESAARIPVGSEGMIFLPYLCGERAPHMDSAARGMFFGLTLKHEHAHMARAVMEGVAFSLKESLDLFDELGIAGQTIIASGGASNSDAWLQILADVFEREVRVCQVKEQACLGACIVAGLGTGLFASVIEATDRFVKYADRTYHPTAANTPLYRSMIQTYRALYRDNQASMHVQV